MKYKKQLKALNDLLDFFLKETQKAFNENDINSHDDLFLIATNIHGAIKKIKTINLQLDKKTK